MTKITFVIFAIDFNDKHWFPVFGYTKEFIFYCNLHQNSFRGKKIKTMNGNSHPFIKILPRGCAFSFSSFRSKSREKTDKRTEQLEEKKRQIDSTKDTEGKTNRTSENRKAPSDEGLHVHMNVAMCVTDSETKQKPSNPLIPRTGKILPSSWFGRVFAYSIQFQWEALSILRNEQIVIFHLKYTRGTDLMSSVKLRITTNF